MNLEIQSKWALVTGGSAGIGLAIARALAFEGANVVLASRDSVRVDAAVRALQAEVPGVKVCGEVVDVLKAESLDRLLSALAGAKISPDILIYNSGGPQAGNVLQLPVEAWDQGYATLVRGLVLLCQKLTPAMAARNWGRILAVTSTSAMQVIPQLPISGVFRAGLSSYVKSLAKEVGRSGILVNNLLPGPTRTDRLKDLSTHSPDYYNSMIAETAVGRIAEPAELGKVAAFLVSGANTFVTGTDVLVDGGFTRAL